MSVVVGVQSVASLDLNNADLQSMAISIGVSCCSAGLSFAGRDKTDATVLGLPGKITWSPTMACLVLVRSLEVASRMIAFNLIQVSSDQQLINCLCQGLNISNDCVSKILNCVRMLRCAGVYVTQMVPLPFMISLSLAALGPSQPVVCWHRRTGACSVPCKVCLRGAVLNTAQVTLRGTWFLGHVSGPIAVLLYAAAAGCCFREAELADILAPRTQNQTQSCRMLKTRMLML